MENYKKRYLKCLFLGYIFFPCFIRVGSVLPQQKSLLYCHLLIHAEIYIHILDTYRRNDKRRKKTSLTKYLPLTLLQGLKKGYSRFACDRELETEHNWNILTPNLWPSMLCLSRSLMLNRRSWGSLCWVLAFFTASYQHLLWTPTHLGLKAPSAWCGFPYHISSITPTVCNSTGTWLPPWLRYIIVQRPLDR